jgi:hypothetical protein
VLLAKRYLQGIVAGILGAVLVWRLIEDLPSWALAPLVLVVGVVAAAWGHDHTPWSVTPEPASYGGGDAKGRWLDALRGPILSERYSKDRVSYIDWGTAPTESPRGQARQVPYPLQIVASVAGIATGIGAVVVAIIAL